MMTRDYRIYTFAIEFFSDYWTDSEFGNSRQKHEQFTRKEVKVIAKCQGIAQAWVENRYNLPSAHHREWKLNFVSTEECPQIILDIPY